MRRSLAILAASAVIIVGITACGTASVGPVSDEISIGVTPDQLNGTYGVIATEGLFALDMKAVYEPLFQVDGKTGEYVPALATAYEQSDGWHAATVTLRDGVVFTDGEPLTAEGVKDYFETVSAEDGWWFGARWDAYSPTITVEDELTFTISSATPMDLRSGSFLDDVFRNMAIVSPAALDDLSALDAEPAGAGAYRLESATPGIEARFVRNPDYWNPDLYPFDTMTMKVYADDVAALNALSSGQIDATQLGNQLVDQADSQGFVAHEGTGRFTALYVADRFGTVIPALADQRVREAMALVFDREAINDTLNNGYGTVTSQPFHPSLPEYVEGGDTRYGHDLERARELMAEAGYADGFDLTLPTTSFLRIDQWNAVVQQSLGEIGIRVTYDSFPDVNAYAGPVLGGQYPVFFYSEIFPQALAVFVAPDAVLNVIVKDGDPTVNELWTTVTQAGNVEEADAAAQELGQYVLDEAFLVPFAAANVVWMSKQTIFVDVASSDGGAIRPFDFQPAD